MSCWVDIHWYKSRSVDLWRRDEVFYINLAVKVWQLLKVKNSGWAKMPSTPWTHSNWPSQGQHEAGCRMPSRHNFFMLFFNIKITTFSKIKRTFFKRFQFCYELSESLQNWELSERSSHLLLRLTEDLFYKSRNLLNLKIRHSEIRVHRSIVAHEHF